MTINTPHTMGQFDAIIDATNPDASFRYILRMVAIKAYFQGRTDVHNERMGISSTAPLVYGEDLPELQPAEPKPVPDDEDRVVS